MDELDKKLNETFDGKVLRKDLLHSQKQIQSTNRQATPLFLR